MLNEKHLHAAIVELRSAVSDLSVLVTSMAWESSAVSVHDPRIASIEKALAEAGKSLAATQAERDQGGK